LSRTVQFFAYPNGKIGVDFSERHCEMVESAGFRAGFAGASSTAASGSNLYRIPRCQPWDKTPVAFSLRLLRWLSYGSRNGN
ncbi:MAG: polysaccharide deacetylase, partial [Polynucleobacter sp.]|nr:polysaccharide deacetylase [Polynucleobacter sp.]